MNTEMLQGTPYVAYAYAYPHKTAYRPFEQPIHLESVWANDDQSALFLYLHIPFCEMRCGFCNLFTTVNPADDISERYVKQLEIQASRVREALPGAQFARFAIGGGTPTYLNPHQLERLFGIADRFGIDSHAIPTSVETSPATATPDRLAVLRSYGVERISIGVQSFVEADVRAGGRPQRTADVHTALENIRASGFPTLNIDLIYGLPNQTLASWLESLDATLRWEPEEIYLYPLYVRPLTGLDRRGTGVEPDLRLACYRAARERLLDSGYEQVSMRMFRARHAPSSDGPAYCCQRDGMLGLGVGARSYTQALHYSSEYAVGATSVRQIINDYVNIDYRPVAGYGTTLDDEEQRRRFVIQSLLQVEGVSHAAYQERFGSGLRQDLPQLGTLIDLGLGIERDGIVALTPAGIERSDAIGPWLYSPRIQALTERFELR